MSICCRFTYIYCLGLFHIIVINVVVLNVVNEILRIENKHKQIPDTFCFILFVNNLAKVFIIY